MLFKVEKGADVFQLNPELKAITEFERLTERQMTYVILSTDYKTPFRKLSAEERKFHAAVEAGYKLEKDSKRLDMNGRNLVAGKVGNVEAAIGKYNTLQYDEDYETLISVKTLIKDIKDINLKPDKTVLEIEKAVNITVGKLDKLVETKKRLEEILEMREDAPIDAKAYGQEEDTVNVDDLPLLARRMEKSAN